MHRWLGETSSARFAIKSEISAYELAVDRHDEHWEEFMILLLQYRSCLSIIERGGDIEDLAGYLTSVANEYPSVSIQSRGALEISHTLYMHTFCNPVFNNLIRAYADGII